LTLRLADDWRTVRLAYGIAVASISGGAGEDAEPTNRHVASVYRLTGRTEGAGSDPDAQPISDKAIAKKLRSMKRWVDGAAA
jgi:hypothetical protein